MHAGLLSCWLIFGGLSLTAAVLDTTRDGWSKHFEFIEQAGWDTGNFELQDYRPEQVQVRNDGAHLVLQRQDVVYQQGRNDRFLSGKLVSKRTLVELAPEGGRLSVIVRGPKVTQFWGTPTAGAGLWPSVWLLTHKRSDEWPKLGEIDLMEHMRYANRPETVTTSASRLHYGPRRGVAMVWALPQSAQSLNYGMDLARFKWTGYRTTLQFDFLPDAQKSWMLAFSVNGSMIWNLTTSRRATPFRTFHTGKVFRGADARDFAEGAEGDPARIFQRAFSDPSRGMNIVINFAFGGTAFGGTASAPGSIDWNIKAAEFVVERVLLTRRQRLGL